MNNKQINDWRKESNEHTVKVDDKLWNSIEEKMQSNRRGVNIISILPYLAAASLLLIVFTYLHKPNVGTDDTFSMEYTMAYNEANNETGSIYNIGELTRLKAAYTKLKNK